MSIAFLAGFSSIIALLLILRYKHGNQGLHFREPVQTIVINAPGDTGLAAFEIVNDSARPITLYGTEQH